MIKSATSVVADTPELARLGELSRHIQTDILPLRHQLTYDDMIPIIPLIVTLTL